MKSSIEQKNLLKQAGILAIAGIISRVIGLLYGSPLAAIIGDEGNGYYGAAYNVYTIILLISAYSIPSAMSKIISGKLAVKEYRNAHRIFKCALVYVAIVGGIGSLILFFGADILATGNSALVLRFFAPTIFVFGFLGVLRGYFQAHRTMVPTSISQLIEQILNAIVSVGGALILTNIAGNEDLTKRAVYGAIGSAIGTGSGVVIALLFMYFVYCVNRKGIHKRVDADTHEDIPTSEIFRLILMIVTPFIISTAIYNLSSYLNNVFFNRILMNVRQIDEQKVASMYGIFIRKSMLITNIPIAFASAAASAMMPELSAAFSKGDKAEVRDIVSRVLRVIYMIAVPCAVGLFALARPVITILFPQRSSIGEASMLLMVLSVTVIFYSISTVTNAVLQGIGKLIAPVINAAISLVAQGVILVPLLLYTNLNDIALCIVTIVYSLMMCVLNNIVMKKYVPARNDFRKAYLLPTISAAVMGGVAFGVFKLFEFLFGLFVPSWYFVNLFATMFAVAAAIPAYFVVLIKSGGASEEDIRRFPKGTAIVRLLKKFRVM
ncbi:MAG: polysaccharide biosynthesis protein [Butyrivibrio sp.]|jgi:stage V sporulation protein B|uniref:putative polysaccharide biosynthesis protein n=1 Tax=Butyrivibrio sp. TaxID=28121 RepID=UPI001EC0A4B8|nr:polysaccharide biosynthesis protein [Butyrivibrio sp.]MBE5842424.1 polysaccharide biosynthesis protein [Butyrivibrio sp.]